MKIIVADDHAVVRKGLKQILLEMSGVKAVEEVEADNVEDSSGSDTESEEKPLKERCRCIGLQHRNDCPE